MAGKARISANRRSTSIVLDLGIETHRQGANFRQPPLDPQPQPADLSPRLNILRPHLRRIDERLALGQTPIPRLVFQIAFYTH